MDKKTTLLERYWAIRLEFEAAGKETVPEPPRLWWYQELVYRISVLEVLKCFTVAAPFTNDMKSLIPHYQVVNGYIEHIRKERASMSSDPERLKQQQTALSTLSAVITDYRTRYKSYAPKSPEQYGRDITRTVAAVLPAWVQYRNTLVEIKIEEASS